MAPDIDVLIEMALQEDLGDGDHTSLSTIPAEASGTAALFAKEEGIICGIEIGEKVFHKLDPNSKFTAFYKDGDRIKPGDKIFEVNGKSSLLLQAERLALNFMQRMSGVATATANMTQLLEGLSTKILDTRKTTPLLRQLEKYAVKCGGGTNHRIGLYDMIMIKDNHVDFAGGIAKAIDAACDYLKQHEKELKIEIEVRNFEELDQVLNHGGVDRIMLDNFTPVDMKVAVDRIGGRYETEASGGITHESIRSYAETGVDYISVGALTHHIKSLDLSLKVI